MFLQVSAQWSIRHIPVEPPRLSAIAQETEPLPKLPDDDPDVFAFSEYRGVQEGPAMPLESAAACLPEDMNRLPGAVFKQRPTQVTWNKDIDLATSLRHKNDGTCVGG